MYIKIFVPTCAFLLSNCASLKDSGRAYFNPHKSWAGVETPQQVVERVEHNKKVRHILYGSLKEDQIVDCTILRNQIYVASLSSLSGDDARELNQVRELLEQAYQQDDKTFLDACGQVFDTKIGKLFGDIQENFFNEP